MAATAGTVEPEARTLADAEKQIESLKADVAMLKKGFSSSLSCGSARTSKDTWSAETPGLNSPRPISSGSGTRYDPQ